MRGPNSARSEGASGLPVGKAGILRTKGLSLPRSVAQNFSAVGLL